MPLIDHGNLEGRMRDVCVDRGSRRGRMPVGVRGVHEGRAFMNALAAFATVVVLAGVAVFIMLFERQRARRIEQDLRDSATMQRDSGGSRGRW